MTLLLPSELAHGYKSASQQARVVTEGWGEQNLFCPNCLSSNLSRQRDNTKVVDFVCLSCGFRYQLKGQKSQLGVSIPDGAYGAMMEAIRDDALPSMYFLHYDLATWSVRNLLLVPHFAFPPSAIIRRKPLSPTARRHGWVGCNFDLSRVPADARIPLVITRGRGRESAPSSPWAGREGEGLPTPAATVIVPPEQVREQFRRVKPLAGIAVTERGWTLDVLNIVAAVCDRRSLPTPTPGAHRAPPPPKEFTNADIYAHARELEQLHPGNRHVKDKIRQQLQVLRDAGLLIHAGRGAWRLP